MCRRKSWPHFWYLQHVIEPLLQCGDLRCATASLGFQPHSRKQIKRVFGGRRRKKNSAHKKNKKKNDWGIQQQQLKWAKAIKGSVVRDGRYVGPAVSDLASPETVARADRFTSKRTYVQCAWKVNSKLRKIITTGSADVLASAAVLSIFWQNSWWLDPFFFVFFAKPRLTVVSFNNTLGCKLIPWATCAKNTNGTIYSVQRGGIDACCLLFHISPGFFLLPSGLSNPGKIGTLGPRSHMHTREKRRGAAAGPALCPPSVTSNRCS